MLAHHVRRHVDKGGKIIEFLVVARCNFSKRRVLMAQKG
jgi:hypothetical protein